MTLFSIILWIHIIAGFAALFSAMVAIASKVADWKHSIHVFFGRIFFIGMIVVFLTTVPMTIMRPNLFLLLIGIFSFYLAYTGWRVAVNRKGDAKPADLAGLGIMILTSVIMTGYGVYAFLHDLSGGIVLIVFGLIGASLCRVDYKRIKTPLKGKDRIRTHLTFMMAATIATVTAFMTTNFQTDPAWLVWLLPTVVITPIIVWMNRTL